MSTFKELAENDNYNMIVIKGTSAEDDVLVSLQIKLKNVQFQFLRNENK